MLAVLDKHSPIIQFSTILGFHGKLSDLLFKLKLNQVLMSYPDCVTLNFTTNVYRSYDDKTKSKKFSSSSYQKRILLTSHWQLFGKTFRYWSQSHILHPSSYKATQTTDLYLIPFISNVFHFESGLP